MIMTKANFPKLRFKGFSDEWEEKRLEDISSITMGQSPSSKSYTDDSSYSILVQGNADLKEGRVFPRVYTSQVTKKSKKNDIIMTVRAPVGELAINQYDDIVIGRGVASISSNIFIYYLLDRLKNIGFWNQLSSGSTFEAINSNDIKKVLIKFGSDEEQQKIGYFFEKIDKLIELQTKKLEDLKKLKQGYLQKMFPQDGEKVPRLRFKGFSDEWGAHKIGDVFNLGRGLVLPKGKISKNKDKENPYPVYSSQTKNNGLLGYYSEFLFENAITWTTDGANAGTVNFRDGKFYSTNVNGVLTGNKQLSNLMIATAINNVAFKYVSHVGNPKLMNNTMSSISIDYPSEKEIDRLSSLLDNLNRLINLNDIKIYELNNLKKSYLQKMFI